MAYIIIMPFIRYKEYWNVLIPTFGENKYDYAYIIMVSKDGHEFIINKGGTVYA